MSAVSTVLPNLGQGFSAISAANFGLRKKIFGLVVVQNFNPCWLQEDQLQVTKSEQSIFIFQVPS
jgi:hypothetical protein